eukprot:1430106-Prymnesium_polylepis.1
MACVTTAQVVQRGLITVERVAVFAQSEYVTGNGRYVGQWLQPTHTRRVDSGSRRPQATWDRASQGAARLAE